MIHLESRAPVVNIQNTKLVFVRGIVGCDPTPYGSITIVTSPSWMRERHSVHVSHVHHVYMKLDKRPCDVSAKRDDKQMRWHAMHYN